MNELHQNRVRAKIACRMTHRGDFRRIGENRAEKSQYVQSVSGGAGWGTTGHINSVISLLINDLV